MKSDDLALMGFGSIGLIVGAVVRRTARGPCLAPPRAIHAPIVRRPSYQTGGNGEDKEIGSNETVRRVPKRS